MARIRKKHAPNSAKFGRTCWPKRKQSAKFVQTCTIRRVVGGYFDRLPCEILHSIAALLPFTSIIQLRCSSKFWYNHLKDPTFVDLHLTSALQKPPGYLFTTLPEPEQKKQSCYFVEPLGAVHLNASKIFEYSTETIDDAYISTRFQSSGGLMCSYSIPSNCFRIFNPHIAEEVQVPGDPGFKKWNFRHCYFFNYSATTKEYKILKVGVLRVLRDGRKRNVFGLNVAAVCTLGNNNWREIQNVPNIRLFLCSFAELNGILFWMRDSNLVSFDLVSEKFHVIPGPPPVSSRGEGCVPQRWSLISMGDTVGYVKNYQLWVLEDKTKGVWINRFKFSIFTPYKNLRIKGVSESGCLFGFIENSTVVFSHDVNMGYSGFRVMKINFDEHERKEGPKSIQHIVPHVRSLVSPARVTKMGKKLPKNCQLILERYDPMDISD